MEFTKTISAQEVSEHNTPANCWIVIDDQIWDVTSFAPEHPGGASRKLKVHSSSCLKAHTSSPP